MDNEKNNSCDCGCSEEHVHENQGCGCDEGQDCGCGCEEHDQESIIVDLEDENGNIVSCEVVEEFEYNESIYALVQNPDNGAVYLFKEVEKGEEVELVVPEEEEFEKATAYYESTLKEDEE